MLVYLKLLSENDFVEVKIKILFQKLTPRRNCVQKVSGLKL